MEAEKVTSILASKYPIGIGAGNFKRAVQKDVMYFHLSPSATFKLAYQPRVKERVEWWGSLLVIAEEVSFPAIA